MLDQRGSIKKLQFKAILKILNNIEFYSVLALHAGLTAGC